MVLGGLIVAVWWCGLLCCFDMSCRFVVVDLMCGRLFVVCISVDLVGWVFTSVVFMF